MLGKKNNNNDHYVKRKGGKKTQNYTKKILMTQITMMV